MITKERAIDIIEEIEEEINFCCGATLDQDDLLDLIDLLKVWIKARD